MRLRHPHQCRAQRVGFAGVDGDADAAAADIDRAHVVDAALAAATIGSRALKALRRVERAVHLGAVARCRAVRDGGRSRPPRCRLRSPGHKRRWRSSERPWRPWPRSAKGAASAKPRSISVSSISVFSRRLVSASSRRNPVSSRIRTMAWPPMARPIASMAWPLEVVRLSRKPSPVSRNASTAWSICNAGSGGSQVPKARMRCGVASC